MSAPSLANAYLQCQKLKQICYSDEGGACLGCSRRDLVCEPGVSMWCGVSNWCVCGSDRSRDACQQNGCPYALMTTEQFNACIGHDDRLHNKTIRKILRVLLLQANMTVRAGFGYHFTDVAPRDMSVGLHGRHPPPHANGHRSWCRLSFSTLPISFECGQTK